MYSVLLCLHVDKPVSGSEEGGSQVKQTTENFFVLCFVFTVGCKAMGHITMPWIKCDVCMGHQMLNKSKF